MRRSNIAILLSILLVLGGVFYYLNIPKPAAPVPPKYYAWLVEMDSIQHIKISLFSENKSESFIKISEADKFPWYFDDPQRSDIDTKRWGGGIPLLLSGPGVDRIISRNTTPEKLTEFGLTPQPQMEIQLILTDNTTMNIMVGNSTPDRTKHYVLAPNTNNDVATVDYTWYNEIARLVTQPPYATPPP